jgi:diadenosine tetraphosphate (Ap4A) HIT family hydrolase
VAASPCPFCQKLATLNELPADELVIELPHSAVLLGHWQAYHGYCIVVARRHCREIFELDPVERRSYFEEMCLVARAINECFRPHKLNYELLGNQVPHLHWHLFPRYEDDSETLKPVWLAIDRAEGDEIERERLQRGRQPRAATAAQLRDRILSLRQVS